MTPSPGRIRTIVPIDLPRPREVTFPEFNAYRREITNLLQHSGHCEKDRQQ
jgi:NitT/TauT family transport system ATP-binding protein